MSRVEKIIKELRYQAWSVDKEAFDAGSLWSEKRQLDFAHLLNEAADLLEAYNER